MSKRKKEEWELIVDALRRQRAEEDEVNIRVAQNIGHYQAALRLLKDLHSYEMDFDKTYAYREELFRRVKTFVEWAEKEGLYER